MGDNNRRLAVRESKQKADVDKTVKGRVFTQGKRKQSETERNKSAIMGHVCKTNHLIDWDSAKMV